MNLVSNDYYFQPALTAKQNTLKAAIKLVIDLEEWAKTVENQERRQRCLAAVTSFKKSIEAANKPNTYVSDLIRAKQNLFEVFNSIDPDIHNKSKALLNDALALQDQEEMRRTRDETNSAIGWALFVLVIDVLIGISLGMVLLPVALIFCLPVGLLATVFMLVGYFSEDHLRQSGRGIVSGQIAIPLASLEAQLYPSRQHENARRMDAETQTNAAERMETPVIAHVDTEVLVIAQPLGSVTSQGMFRAESEVTAVAASAPFATTDVDSTSNGYGR